MISLKVPTDFGSRSSKGGREAGGLCNCENSSKNVFNWTISIVVMKIEYLYDTDV